MSVAYEAVQYTSGSVAGNTPAGFADQSVGYDVTPSPLGYLDDAMIPGGGAKGLLPALIGLGTSALLSKAFGNNTRSSNIVKDLGVGIIGGIVGNVLSQNKLPVPDPQNAKTASTSSSNNSRMMSASSINGLLSQPSIASQVLPSLLNSGAIPNVGINEFNSATTSQQASYTAQVTNKIANGDQKLTQLASNALTNLGFGT